MWQLKATGLFPASSELHLTANFIEFTCDIGWREAVLPDITSIDGCNDAMSVETSKDSPEDGSTTILRNVGKGSTIETA